MSRQEEKYFEALTKDREDGAKTLDKLYALMKKYNITGEEELEYALKEYSLRKEAEEAKKAAERAFHTGNTDSSNIESDDSADDIEKRDEVDTEDRAENIEPPTDNTEIIIHCNSKRVSKCRPDGTVIKTYKSQTLAAEDNCVNPRYISYWVNGREPDPRGYIWKRDEVDTEERAENIEPLTDNMRRIIYCNSKRVSKCRPDGTVIKTYESQSVAAEDNGVEQTDISNLILNKVKDPRGYIWKRNEISTEEPVINTKPAINDPERVAANYSNRVSKCRPDGTIIKTYESSSVAARMNGVKPINISKWILGMGKDPRGYIWKREILSQISNTDNEASSPESVEKEDGLNATEDVIKDIIPITNDKPGVFESSSTDDLKTFCGCVIGRDGEVIERTGSIKEQTVNDSGYYQVTFCRGSEEVCRTIHSLVAELYLPKTDKDQQFVRHINGDKLDNRVENLEWVSGNVSESNQKIQLDVLKCDMQGNVIEKYESPSVAAKMNGVGPIDISKWILGMGKDPRGYIWKRDEVHAEEWAGDAGIDKYAPDVIASPVDLKKSKEFDNDVSPK